MKRPLLLLALLFALVAPGLAVEAPAGARMGLLAVRVATGEILVERNADERFVPASALKVLTAAAALQALGPDHRFRTRVLGLGDDGLVLEGGGDPTLTSDDLRTLADAVGDRRVRRVIADPSALAGPPLGPGWAWEDAPLAFSAEVSGLTVDRGRLRVQVAPAGVGQPPRVEGCPDLLNRARTVAPGGASTWEFVRLPGRAGTILQGEIPADEAPTQVDVAVVDPARRAGELFAAPFGAVVQVAPAEGGEVLAEHLSAPLAEILAQGLAESDNLVLECVYRSVPDPPSRLPLPPGSVRMVDGSGLSRYNLATPRAFVEVLRARPDLGPLLPAPGEGTLATRLAGLPVRAKTGSMGGLSALVGYVHPEDPARTVAFAMLTNGFVGPSREVKALEDAFVAELLSPVE